jgi:hypothetical protein
MAEASTKVITGKVRLAYAHLTEAYKSPAAPESAPPKFSTVILIPKTDKKTVAAIQNAQKAALENGKAKFNGKIPNTWTNTLHDGDEDADLEKNPEYAGHYYMTVSNNRQPGLVDKSLQPILDASELYSGCYARVSINAFAFNTSGNKGVSFGLNNVQKLADGESFTGATRAEDDFSAIEDDDDDEPLI